VIARQEEWLRQLEHSEPHAVGIVEAALLLEAGVGRRFDKLVVVTCRPEQKAGRFAQRQNLDLATAEAEVARRQAAQWPDSEKMAAADYIIDNSGSPEDFRAGVERIFAELKSLTQKTGQQNSQPRADSSLEPGPPGRPQKI
jgi:dephospho-CoA kinase